MNRPNRLAREEEMRNRISNWQASGKSLKIYCREEKFSIDTFRYWLRKLGISARKCSKNDHGDSFIPLVLQPERKIRYPMTDKIEIICPNGIEIRLPGNIDAGFIKTLAGIQ